MLFLLRKFQMAFRGQFWDISKNVLDMFSLGDSVSDKGSFLSQIDQTVLSSVFDFAEIWHIVIIWLKTMKSEINFFSDQRFARGEVTKFRLHIAGLTDLYTISLNNCGSIHP